MRRDLSQVLILQPALPAYRWPLFQRLAQSLDVDFVVYSSCRSELGCLEDFDQHFVWHRRLNVMKQLPFGLEWQPGVLSIPLSRGCVLVVSGAPRSISTLFVLIKAKLRGARTVWWGHYWSSTSKPWRSSIRYMLMRLADVILFYTDQEIDEYAKQKGGRLPRPVFALNNGVETDVINRYRERYAASIRPRDLLFIGRLTKKAELDLLLRALATNECQGISLDVVGDGVEFVALRELAHKLDLEERVTWHGGSTNEARIAGVANRCKMFVYPGSVGLSLIHALAYGLPAVIHNDRWTHMPESAALRSGKNGFEFQKGDVNSLACTLSALVRDHEALDNASRSALRTTHDSFNIKDMVVRFRRAVISAAK